MVKKNFSIILYLLCTILILILSIFVYRVVTHIYYLGLNDQIATSKHIVKTNSNTDFKSPIKIATFKSPNNEDYTAALASADVVIEFLSSSYGITYKAIFNQEVAKGISSKINLQEYSNSSLPVFNFSGNTNPAVNDGADATSIFINFNEDLSSNFLYQNGHYYHYKGLGTNQDNNTPLKLSNVVIQFINGDITSDETLTTPEDHGAGLLFCDGKAKEIQWDNKGDSQTKIADQNGAPISLLDGSTWWIFINKNSSVAYD